MMSLWIPTAQAHEEIRSTASNDDDENNNYLPVIIYGAVLSRKPSSERRWEQMTNLKNCPRRRAEENVFFFCSLHLVMCGERITVVRGGVRGVLYYNVSS